MVCPRCGSSYVQMQTVAEQQKRGCLLTGLMILLLFVPILGWITLFILIRGRQSETITYAVCQNCGNRWPAGMFAPMQPPPLVSAEPRFDTLTHNVQCVLSQIIEGDISVSDNRNDWKILKTGLKYTMRSDIKLDDDFHDALIEIEFHDTTYDTFGLTRLQIDGNDIKTA